VISVDFHCFCKGTTSEKEITHFTLKHVRFFSVFDLKKPGDATHHLRQSVCIAGKAVFSQNMMS